MNLQNNTLISSSLRFGLYELRARTIKNERLSRYLIVLKDSESEIIVQFTDFHKYITSAKGHMFVNVTNPFATKFKHVVMMLNYLFFDTHQISALNEITPEMIEEFLTAYSNGQLPGEEDKARRGSSKEQMASDITDFMLQLIMDAKTGLKFKEEDLFENIERINKNGKLVKKRVPRFKILCSPDPNGNRRLILRDMPDKVFNIFMRVIIEKHTNLLMLAALSAFAGLRPSETLNVRREDSPLGRGIFFDRVDGEVTNISIDVQHDLPLRADNASTGGIKRNRTQRVYPAFIKAFCECYSIYMRYIADRKCDMRYGALTCDSRGNAMTYEAYSYQWRSVVADSIAEMMNSNDPELIEYAFLLRENHFGPHSFRHWFSVQLVLMDEDVQGLMYWRGDTSPESALTYIQNKSDLLAKYHRVESEMTDYMLWAAKKRKENE